MLRLNIEMADTIVTSTDTFFEEVIILWQAHVTAWC